MKTITYNQLFEFISKHRELIHDIVVQSVKAYDFNNIEGKHYDIKIKIYTTKEYKNTILVVKTNSTYLEDIDEVNIYTMQGLINIFLE